MVVGKYMVNKSSRRRNNECLPLSGEGKSEKHSYKDRLDLKLWIFLNTKVRSLDFFPKGN